MFRVWNARDYSLRAEARGHFEAAIECITFARGRHDVIRALDVQGHLREFRIGADLPGVSSNAADSPPMSSIEIGNDIDVRFTLEAGRRHAKMNRFSESGNTLLCAAWNTETKNRVHVFRIHSSGVTRFDPEIESSDFSIALLSANGTSLIVCCIDRDTFEEGAVEDEWMLSKKCQLYVWPKIDFDTSGTGGYKIEGLYASWGLDGEYLIVYTPAEDGEMNKRTIGFEITVYKTTKIRRNGLRSCLGKIRLESELNDIRAQVIRPRAQDEHLCVLVYAISTSGRRRLLLWDVTDNEVLREVAVEMPLSENIDIDQWRFRGVPSSEIFECGCYATSPETYFCRIMEDQYPKFDISPDGFWASVYSCKEQSFALVSMRSETTAWNFALPKEWGMHPFQMWNQMRFDPSGKHFLVFGDSAILACAPSFLPENSLKSETWTWERPKASRAWQNQDNPLAMLQFNDKTRKTASDVFYGLSSEALADILSANTAIEMQGIEPLESILRRYPGSRHVVDAMLSADGRYLAFILNVKGRGNVVHSCDLAKVFDQSNEGPAPPYSMPDKEFAPARVLLYENAVRPMDAMVLMPRGYKPVVVFCNIETLATTKMELPLQKCMRISQAADRRTLLILDTHSVCVFDLPQREVLRTIEYAADVSKLIRLAGKSRKWRRAKNTYRDKNAERRISDDGEAVLLAWDAKNDKGVIVTPEMDQSTCEAAIEASENTLSDFCVLARNGKHVTYIDCEGFSNSDVKIGIYSLKRIPIASCHPFVTLLLVQGKE